MSWSSNCSQLVEAIKTWKLAPLHEINASINAHKLELASVDACLHMNRTIYGLIEQDLRMKLNSLSQQRTSFWAQRAKRNWIHFDDVNSRYFHARATSQKCNNFIHGIRNSNGDWVTTPKEMCQVFLDFYKVQASTVGCDLKPFCAFFK